MVNSNPPGARFQVDGISGTTPAVVPVERKVRQHTVTISKPGYETAQVGIGRKLDLLTAGNLIMGIGAPIGIGVDVISGSAFKLALGTVHVDLQPEHPVAACSPTGGPAEASTIRQAQEVGPAESDPGKQP